MANVDRRIAPTTYPVLLGRDRSTKSEFAGEVQAAGVRASTTQRDETPVPEEPSRQAASPPQQVLDVLLSKEEALSLQSELMEAFSAPAFQKQLHELGRLHGVGTDGCRALVLKLVRSKQVEIISRFGLQSSQAGIEGMLSAFKSLETDPDIQVNNMAMKELLCLSEMPFPTPVPEVRMVVQRPSTKHRVMDVLRVQLIEFSKATFQLEVEELKRQAKVSDAAGGFYHLPGRADLALIVQQVLLPQYGFAGSKEGVQDMIQHCARKCQDPDVASLLDRVNDRLGMSAAACDRFRDLLGYPAE
ncbi:unnamed protein product [Symbiodinium sp. CCMP2592]|nr:unnamed protein product [Symbiodinium sp. CCMP2592]